MSEAHEKMKRLEESSNKEILERAWAEITALCSEGKQWRMTVPVDADRDSDILFGEALMRFAKLEAEIEQLKKDVAPFQAQIDQAKTYTITPDLISGGER